MNRTKINVILDLDNTLISAIDEEEAELMGLEVLAERQRKLTWINMEDEFKIFSRPGLQKFLSWLFANFNVSVWTAASKTYASFIIQNIVIAGIPGRKLDYILFSHHCHESKRSRKFQKSLSMMSDVFPLGYDIANTYIIDDNKEVYEAQPNMCIRIKPFDVQNLGCERDTELLKVKRSLEIIRIRRLK